MRRATTISSDHPLPRPLRAHRFALLGNPNTGKTTLFNRLCGARTKTANIPGSTVEARHGVVARRGRSDGQAKEAGACAMTDLPGVYSLSLNTDESEVCRRRLRDGAAEDGVIVVVDAMNLPRNLRLVAEVLARRRPTVIALNMIDLAERRGLRIDVEELARRLDCPVVPVCARSGRNVDRLIAALDEARISAAAMPDEGDTVAMAEWARTCSEAVERAAVGRLRDLHADLVTDRLDRLFTHPILGMAIFATVMTALFASIFWLAQYPMEWIETAFALLSETARGVLPAGAIASLLVDGVIPGIAGAAVFLPQIVLLFFLISLLEDTGYLARASFLMDRLLRQFGLPGQSFVPLLSAHACAIPAITAARMIPFWRDRLATILIAPFMSCSARLPVYVLLIGILFGTRPLLAGLAFAGCYLLGAVAALLSALVLRSTLLRGQARPMMIELPSYKRPSLRTATLTAMDRGVLFARRVGTVIVAIVVVLWWLASYPIVEPSPNVEQLRADAAALAEIDPDAAAEVETIARQLQSREALAGSFMGRLGRAAEPVFAPIGCDWQLTVGVLSSFAAREVFVSTMAVVLSAGSEEEAESAAVLARIRTARRDDGSALLTPATSMSLLVFYVLAMQCLPTLAVTARESGKWRWAALQFAWMSGVAYALALVTFQLSRYFGVV